MKSTCPILLMTLLTSTTQLFGQTEKRSTTNDEAVKQELIRLDKQLATAEQKGDASVLERLLATEYTITDQTGRIGRRSESIARVREHKGEHLSAPVTADYEIKLLGNSAVMTHLTAFKTGDGSSEQLRATHVWVRRNGKWKILSDACTAVQRVEPNAPALTPDAPVFNAACSATSFEPEVEQFYGDSSAVLNKLSSDRMHLAERRAYVLLVETNDAAELTFFERTGSKGTFTKVSRWSGKSAGDLRERLSTLILNNRGIACVGRQSKAMIDARFRPAVLGEIPAPVSAAAAFTHIVRKFGNQYLRATVFLLC